MTSVRWGDRLLPTTTAAMDAPPHRGLWSRSTDLVGVVPSSLGRLPAPYYNPDKSPGPGELYSAYVRADGRQTVQAAFYDASVEPVDFWFAPSYGSLPPAGGRRWDEMVVADVRSADASRDLPPSGRDLAWVAPFALGLTVGLLAGIALSPSGRRRWGGGSLLDTRHPRPRAPVAGGDVGDARRSPR